MSTEQCFPLSDEIPLQPSLPFNILLLIKQSIPLDDIRTHICFYRTHLRIAAMYDSENDADVFWRRVCWHSGVSAVGKDNLEDERCWRNIALEVIKKDGFCQHPQCGEALLEYNRQRMAQAEERLEPLAIFSDWRDEAHDGSASDSDSDSNAGDNDNLGDVDTRTANQDGEDSEEYEPPELEIHRVLLRLAFRSKPSGWYYGVCDDAQLGAQTDEERAYAGSVLLRDHPLVQRSFATDLPVNRFCLGNLGKQAFSRERIKRRNGVTVIDVAASIYLDLEVRLSRRDREELLDVISYGFFPSRVNEDDDQMRTFRSVLADSHFGDFYYTGDLRDGAPVFVPSIEEN